MDGQKMRNGKLKSFRLPIPELYLILLSVRRIVQPNFTVECLQPPAIVALHLHRKPNQRRQEEILVGHVW